MKQGAESARGDFAGGFINRHDAAGVQRGVALRIIAGEHLELGMHDKEVPRVIVELKLAVEVDAQTGEKLIDEIPSVKPLGEEPLARCVLEDVLEESEVAAAETAEMRGLHFGNDSGH